MENKILNLGILAHVDAGKTTLTESLLYHSGIIGKMGNVDKGTTVTDSMSLEQERGMTIRASTVSFSLEGIKVNLIDTPGHADFFGEVERSLSVLDGVILVLSAVEGVQTQTRILFQYLQRMGIPMCIFINKLDRIGADSGKVCEQIRKQLSPHIVLMQETVAEGGRDCRIRAYDRQEEPFTQQVISQSDALMEKYIDDIPISGEELDEAMKLLVQKGELYPVYAGAALHDIGVAELIKGMTTWLPCSGSGEGDRELSAYVYKIEFEEDGRKKAYIRVYEGSLTRKDRGFRKVLVLTCAIRIMSCSSMLYRQSCRSVRVSEILVPSIWCMTMHLVFSKYLSFKVPFKVPSGTLSSILKISFIPYS